MKKSYKFFLLRIYLGFSVLNSFAYSALGPTKTDSSDVFLSSNPSTEACLGPVVNDVDSFSDLTRTIFSALDGTLDKSTSLFKMIDEGAEEKIQYSMADPNNQNEAGFTPLHIAIKEIYE